MSTPFFDAAPVQRGLDALGQAFLHQKQILDEQTAATASLRVQRKLNDKIDELTTSQDFSGNWGEAIREASQSAADEELGNFHDPAAAQAFQNKVGSWVEGQFPALRQIQLQKMQEYNQSQIIAGDQDALNLAPKDLEAFATSINRRYGADVVLDPVAKTRNVSFNRSSVQAFGGDSGALKSYQKVTDDGVGAWLQAQIDNVAGDTSVSWGDKAKYLENLRKSYGSQIDSNDLHPTAATMAKLDDAMQKAVSGAQTAALKEHKDQGMAWLASTVSSLTPGWTRAKLTGQAYDPAAGFTALLADKGLDTDVREAANTALRTLTLERDKSISPEDTAKGLKNNADSIKNLIQLELKRGADSDYLDSKIVDWMKGGQLDPRNYSEAVAFAKSAPGLEKDPEIQGAMKAGFGTMPPDAQARLEVAFKEQVGGLYNNGNLDAYKTNGRWDTGKLKNLAQDMAKAEKDDALNQILNMNWGTGKTVEWNELCAYVDRASNGKLIGQLTAANVASRAQPFTDALWSNLGATNPELAKTPLNTTYPVTFDLYTRAGVPTFHFADGTTATPSVNGQAISWSISGGRFGRGASK